MTPVDAVRAVASYLNDKKGRSHETHNKRIGNRICSFGHGRAGPSRNVSSGKSSIWDFRAWIRGSSVSGFVLLALGRLD